MRGGGPPEGPDKTLHEQTLHPPSTNPPHPVSYGRTLTTSSSDDDAKDNFTSLGVSEFPGDMRKIWIFP